MAVTICVVSHSDPTPTNGLSDWISVQLGPVAPPTVLGQVGTTNYVYETGESYLLCIPLGSNYAWLVEEDWCYSDPGTTNASDKVYLRNTPIGAVVYFGSDDENGN